LKAQALHKRDLTDYKALFADYLDIQKHLDIHDLNEDEVKGRWKSFFGKWNRGELAEGWYDPETKRKADERYISRPQNLDRIPDGPRNAGPRAQETEPSEDDDGDDHYGPTLPDAVAGRSVGPAIPNLQDLQHRRELAEEDREARAADFKSERKLARQTEKERLEELAPRAAPGSRERQLEKKRDVAASNRSFRDAKDAGMEEVGEGELMGDDGIEGYKAKAKVQERRKNEREIRKEEVLRARASEREERLAVRRVKEEKTMETLRAMARERFG